MHFGRVIAIVSITTWNLHFFSLEKMQQVKNLDSASHFNRQSKKLTRKVSFWKQRIFVVILKKKNQNKNLLSKPLISYASLACSTIFKYARHTVAWIFVFCSVLFAIQKIYLFKQHLLTLSLMLACFKNIWFDIDIN